MQFMGQSMGWADNAILAMVPLGIITAIVSTIRVGGPTWLKALIGRAWESRAIVESELMSSTSNEVCELWNDQQIVRVMGEGQIREFIILVADDRETYVVAVFGTLLQICLLVYAGLTATYLSGSTQLQENPPASYAFPCIAAGTLMLVSGMLVCGHVVEGSTSERRYRPVDGKEARVVWLQRSGIVNDQSFESFAISPTKAQPVITASQRTRQGRNSTSQGPSARITVEMVTMAATAITIYGFVVQFVGLRRMN
ncbi:hypothetical protein B0T25DRAFT_588922 [Lasiosphaeria hispida]|uniref:Uncharacterized protein n=1 Tax=Lasiosphaeria hispida TaxID=260671 RepID=A0AAJ0MJ15_9PEZI|nr:hypothetical protein B0T25DRAFT_588922 [Lasiosphaeria hispida]